jgi:glycosyltransferase involved in cell wall biosynthesis
VRIAFYAPLKPPTHPTPSGDRRVARLLQAALRRSGHDVTLASKLRSRAAEPDPKTLDTLRRRGERTAARLIERARAAPANERPELWFTYHLYYKAPDWLGPAVADALAIPYVVAEASHAPKRAAGPWADYHAAVETAIRRADLVIGLNPADLECVAPLRPKGRPPLALKPFLDPRPFVASTAARETHRAEFAKRLNLDPAQPWLLAVAMMRAGDKEASYRVLAEALARIAGRPWQLVIVGDGEAKPVIEAAFAPIAERVRFHAAAPLNALPAIYASADLFVWPAVNEAFGMALLEAQASGLPVVAGDGGGVPAIVAQGRTGLLVSVGDAAAFADAVATLLDDPEKRRTMGAAAMKTVAAEHAIDSAAAKLDAALGALVGGRRP